MKSRRHIQDFKEPDLFSLLGVSASPPKDNLPPRDHPSFYKLYLKSNKWKVIRAAALVRGRGRCVRCGGTYDLEVHHLTYERLGCEMPSDLVVVCKTCHPQLDREREAAALRRARYAGWVSKVYGDDYYDDEETYERYERWLEKRGDFYE